MKKYAIEVIYGGNSVRDCIVVNKYGTYDTDCISTIYEYPINHRVALFTNLDEMINVMRIIHSRLFGNDPHITLNSKYINDFDIKSVIKDLQII